MKKLSGMLFADTGTNIVLTALVGVAIVSGCSKTETGEEAAYEQLVGNQYRISRDLLVFGITADENYKPEVDYYVVTEPPGVDGPEVVTRGVLRHGTVIRIAGVEPCADCPLHGPRLVISPVSNETYADRKMVISDIGEPNLFQFDGDKVALDPELFVGVDAR